MVHVRLEYAGDGDDYTDPRFFLLMVEFDATNL